MTREEAIKIFNTMLLIIYDGEMKISLGSVEEIVEAVKMAISALSDLAVAEKECEQLDKESGVLVKDDLISRKAVLDLAKDLTFEGGCKHRCVDATEIKLLPTIPQTDSVLEDIKAEIEKLPRIKVGNSNSPTVKYCIDERLIYEVVYKHISGK